MNVRIDFVDPSPEGAQLLLALRGTRFDVFEREVNAVPRTNADVLVLAGDTRGALEALRRLRDDGAFPDVPVVLLGTPEGITHRGGGQSGLGAEAVFLRPIDRHALLLMIDELAHRVKQSSRRLSENPTATTARERTMQLSVEGRLKEAVQETPSTHPESMTPSSGGGVRAPFASVSERLCDLLLSADRRAFPTRPAIDMALPGGDESAAELLPSELFEHDELVVDVLALEEDPIDAFTFVGGPVLPEESSAAGAEESIERTPSTLPKSSPPTSPNRPSKMPLRTELEPKVRGDGWDAANGPVRTGVHESILRPDVDSSRVEESDWPREDSVLGRIDAEGMFRGSAAEGDLLPVLFRITSLRHAVRLVITANSVETRMTLREGELVLVESDIAVRAADALARRGANVPRSSGEDAARSALEDAVRRGVVSRLEHERALREAREQLLVDLIRAQGARFALERCDEARKLRLGPLPFGIPFRAALAEAARRAVSKEQWMQGDFGFERTGRFDEIAAEGWIRPEMASLIAAHENVAASRLLDEAQGELGVPGLLSALIAAGALRIVPVAPRARQGERTPHARRMIEEACVLVEDADYFRILSVSMAASEMELAEAYRTRTSELQSIDLEALGLGALESARRGVLDAMAEAHRVLRNPRWRDAYTNALRG